jgi:hypothetical protein
VFHNRLSKETCASLVFADEAIEDEDNSSNAVGLADSDGRAFMIILKKNSSDREVIGCVKMTIGSKNEDCEYDDKTVGISMLSVSTKYQRKVK